jgi:hypothetical protein
MLYDHVPEILVRGHMVLAEVQLLRLYHHRTYRDPLGLVVAFDARRSKLRRSVGQQENESTYAWGVSLG